MNQFSTPSPREIAALPDLILALQRLFLLTPALDDRDMSEAAMAQRAAALALDKAGHLPTVTSFGDQK